MYYDWEKANILLQKLGYQFISYICTHSKSNFDLEVFSISKIQIIFDICYAKVIEE